MQNRSYNKKPPRSNNTPAAGLYVEVRNGDIAGALRKFKKKVQESGVLQDYKDRQEYVKPSEKRKRAKAAAVRRHQRTMSKRLEELGY